MPHLMSAFYSIEICFQMKMGLIDETKKKKHILFLYSYVNIKQFRYIKHVGTSFVKIIFCLHSQRE